MDNNSILDRFITAQNSKFLGDLSMYSKALSEIKAEKKTSHWMWFIFPQMDGLGLSEKSKKYSIKSSQESIAYLQHELLSNRLIDITRAFLSIEEKSATDILGRTDALKMRSSMTLFAAVQSENSLFEAVLQKFYDGEKCKRTLLLLTEN
ncbi:MAG: DUF1810 family protein [Crocinitomicaceae bacterium]|nr:DUF1810 family protein [Crocinitomicaceae bacterium]